MLPKLYNDNAIDISVPFLDFASVRQTDNQLLIRSVRFMQVESPFRIVMEHTGCYYEILTRQISEANLFVSAISLKLIKDFDNDSLRKVKSDKANAVKIAKYTLDK